MNKGITQQWYPKAEETQNEMYNKDIAVLWKENFIQLDPWNHNYAHRSAFQKKHNQNT